MHIIGHKILERKKLVKPSHLIVPLYYCMSFLCALHNAILHAWLFFSRFLRLWWGSKRKTPPWTTVNILQSHTYNINLQHSHGSFIAYNCISFNNGTPLGIVGIEIKHMTAYCSRVIDIDISHRLFLSLRIVGWIFHIL